MDLPMALLELNHRPGTDLLLDTAVLTEPEELLELNGLVERPL